MQQNNERGISASAHDEPPLQSAAGGILQKTTRGGFISPRMECEPAAPAQHLGKEQKLPILRCDHEPR